LKIRLLAKRSETSLGLFLEWNAAALAMPLAQGTLVAGTLGKILSGILASDNIAFNAQNNDTDVPAQGESSLAKLDLLSKTNLDQLRKWNATVEISPVERCIHEIIAERIAETPDKEAVCSWDGSFTYAEQDDVSTRLADRLVTLGVGPEVFVPLCFDKSVCSCACTHTLSKC
jgi:non-ribosomal peptide synthetase component F